MYYLYGRALLCKAQEETGPLVSVPEKDGEILQDSNKEGPTKGVVTRESSVASVSSNSEQDGIGFSSVFQVKKTRIVTIATLM